MTTDPVMLAPGQALFALGTGSAIPAQVLPDGRLPLLCPENHRGAFDGKRLNECIGPRCAKFHAEGLRTVNVEVDKPDSAPRPMQVVVGSCAEQALARALTAGLSTFWEIQMRVAQAVGVKISRGENGQLIMPPLFPPEG